MRVLIADDHYVFREGLRSLLAAGDELDVVAEAADTAAAVALTLELRPDLVIMDLRMPGEGGVAATRRICAAHPDVKVLVLTMHADQALVRQALQAGARGYILKDAGPDDILRAIAAVAANQGIFDPSVMMGVVAATSHPAASGMSAFLNLSERERVVLERMAQGASNTAIGARLGISVKTVQNHVSNIVLKLGVADRAGAIIKARDAGIGVTPQTDG